LGENFDNFEQSLPSKMIKLPIFEFGVFGEFLEPAKNVKILIFVIYPFLNSVFQNTYSWVELQHQNTYSDLDVFKIR
jgi:hypothetical protein